MWTSVLLTLLLKEAKATTANLTKKWKEKKTKRQPNANSSAKDGDLRLDFAGHFVYQNYTSIYVHFWT